MFQHPLFFVICAAIYVSRVAFFLVGFLRKRELHVLNSSTIRVSVIVPARNEEATIGRCLQSLVESQYPSAYVEFIVVNDRSTDSTAAVIEEFASRHTNIIVLHKTEHDSNDNLRGKPGALAFGIARAKGDVLLLTDADCAVHPGWIQSMSIPFANPKVAMVNGFTTVRSTSFFQHVQNVEWVFSQAMARAGINNGVPLGCFGNNMAIRASVYAQLGGYGAIPFSVTEDLALLQAVWNAGYNVRYLCKHTATVETLPCTTLRQYVTQKHRWARGGLELGWLAGLFVFASVALWAGTVFSVAHQCWGVALAFVLIRFLGDGGLVIAAARRLLARTMFLYIVPAVFLLMITELVVPLLVIRKRVVWKNQVFR
jgi:1,2-diacylglycerol 3-beta-glucosyltransferase